LSSPQLPRATEQSDSIASGVHLSTLAATEAGKETKTAPPWILHIFLVVAIV